MPTPELDQVIALGKEPCAQNPPAGISIQDELAFDQLQTDVQTLVSQLGSAASMQAVGDREPATWVRVANGAFGMLKEKSKDIRLASFLTIAMTHEKGFEGLNASLQMIMGLLTDFWDTMFPPVKLLRGRVNALSYISTQLGGEGDAGGGAIVFHQKKLMDAWEDLLKTNPPQQARDKMFEHLDRQHAALKGAGETMARMRELIYAKFPNDKLPTVTSLTDAIGIAEPDLGALVEKHRPRAAAPAAAETASGGAPAGAGGAGPAAAGGAAGTAVSLENPKDVRKFMARCAPVLRRADLTDPAAFRLTRWAIWGNLTASPPAKDGKTVIPNVAQAEIDQSRQYFTTQNWLQLINQSEERFTQAPFWFDRQYFVHQALGGLGAAYKAAQEAVAGELATLLRRCPDLHTLQFAGGMPFADDTTQAWIASEVLSGSDAPKRASVMSPGTGGSDSGLAEAMNEARLLARDGKLADAIRRLQSGASSGSRSGRERFLWRMAQAQIAQEAGRGKQMTPVLQELVAEIDRHGLEAWEPDLCLRVFRALHQLVQKDKEKAELAQDMYNRMCRIDPAAALE